MSAGTGKKDKPPETLPKPPPAPRLQLDSLVKIRREMAHLYVEAKGGERDVGEASRLANMLALIARLLEGSLMEGRLEAVEKKLGLGP